MAAILFGLALGCGGARTAPVNGRVKFKDGSDTGALAGYEVTLTPENGKASATGTIAADGTFQLSTFGASDGAVPGKYRVAITPPLPSDPDKPPPKPVIAEKYKDAQTSELILDIKSGNNPVELQVERRP